MADETETAGIDHARQQLEVFDSLPPELRQMLAEGPYQYSPVEVAVFYNKLLATGMTTAEVIATVKARWRDMEHRSVKLETQNLYGPEHPQASKWLEWKNPRNRQARYRQAHLSLKKASSPAT